MASWGGGWWRWPVQTMPAEIRPLSGGAPPPTRNAPPLTSTTKASTGIKYPQAPVLDFQYQIVSARWADYATKTKAAAAAAGAAIAAESHKSWAEHLAPVCPLSESNLNQASLPVRSPSKREQSETSPRFCLPRHFCFLSDPTVDCCHRNDHMAQSSHAGYTRLEKNCKFLHRPD